MFSVLFSTKKWGVACLVRRLVGNVYRNTVCTLFTVNCAVVINIIKLISFAFNRIVVVNTFTTLFATALANKGVLLAVLFDFTTSNLVNVIVRGVYCRGFFRSTHCVPLVYAVNVDVLVGGAIRVLFNDRAGTVPRIVPLNNVRVKGCHVACIRYAIVIIIAILYVLLSVFLGGAGRNIVLHTIDRSHGTTTVINVSIDNTALVNGILNYNVNNITNVLCTLCCNSLSTSVNNVTAVGTFDSSMLNNLISVRTSTVNNLLVNVLRGCNVTLFSSDLQSVVTFMFLVVILVFFPGKLHVGVKEGTG